LIGNFELEKHELDTQLNSGLYIRLKRMDPVLEKKPVGVLALRFLSAPIGIFDDLEEDA